VGSRCSRHFILESFWSEEQPNPWKIAKSRKNLPGPEQAKRFCVSVAVRCRFNWENTTTKEKLWNPGLKISWLFTWTICTYSLRTHVISPSPQLAHVRIYLLRGPKRIIAPRFSRCRQLNYTLGMRKYWTLGPIVQPLQRLSWEETERLQESLPRGNQGATKWQATKRHARPTVAATNRPAPEGGDMSHQTPLAFAA